MRENIRERHYSLCFFQVDLHVGLFFPPLLNINLKTDILVQLKISSQELQENFDTENYFNIISFVFLDLLKL